MNLSVYLTVSEGDKTVALSGNTTAGSDKHKLLIFSTRALTYGGNTMLKFLELTCLCRRGC